MAMPFSLDFKEQDITRPGGICQRVTMFPHIQLSVSATPLISQSTDARPHIQQTADMGCQDGC
jgi:hypothetical protein